MVVLSSAEQVTSDSSRSEEVKLQEHISWIVLAMPVFSIRWASIWKSLHKNKETIYIKFQVNNTGSCHSTIRQCSEYLVKVQVFALFTANFPIAKQLKT